MTELVESQWIAAPELTESDAERLARLGQELTRHNPNDEDSSTSVIQCQRPPDGVWRIKVHECVGVIGTGSTAWVVQPKIPLEHLTHLMSLGGTLPQMSGIPAGLQGGSDFLRLLLHWFINQTEQVLRRGLAHGYVASTEDLPFIRGTVEPLALTRGLMRGRVAARCTFEDYRVDTPINRILKSAIRAGIRTGVLDEPAAVRARRLLAHFEGVADATPPDLRVQIDRHTRRYAVAVELGRQILRGTHRELRLGDTRAWCFLWRTPEAVEDGIRQALGRALDGQATVTNRPTFHGDMPFTPDLVIGSVAVGDVKYSLDSGGWRRSPDVYQLLAFATSHERSRALLVNFADHNPAPRTFRVADVELAHLAWNYSLRPGEAESQFSDEAQQWYQSVAEGSTPVLAVARTG